jgi:hypothetical protein
MGDGTITFRLYGEPGENSQPCLINGLFSSLILKTLCEGGMMVQNLISYFLQLKMKQQCKECMIWDSSNPRGAVRIDHAGSFLGFFRAVDQLSTTTPWGTSPRTRATVPISMRFYERLLVTSVPGTETLTLTYINMTMRRCPVSASLGGDRAKAVGDSA